jgi:hypothetical protein
MASKQASSIAVVPFKREKTGHITVAGHLSGKPVRLIVDTGAGGTCIHSGFLEKYKLNLTSKTEKGGGVGTSTMRLTTVASHNLSLQDVDLSPFKLLALDLSHVIAALTRKKVEAFVGVLGADVLHRKHAVIDYARSIILLSR